MLTVGKPIYTSLDLGNPRSGGRAFVYHIRQASIQQHTAQGGSGRFMPGRVFGHISGYPEGASFDSRAALSEAGVHRPTMAGISGSQGEGADSIVLSGGYEDDEDLGDEVVYTGHGGRDAESRRQVAHQRLTKGNLALAHSSIEGLPVRVVRGANLGSPYAPGSGYC